MHCLSGSALLVQAMQPLQQTAVNLLLLLLSAYVPCALAESCSSPIRRLHCTLQVLALPLGLHQQAFASVVDTRQQNVLATAVPD
jgi:hypothetical protein